MYFGGNNHGCQEYSKNVYKYTQADRLMVRMKDDELPKRAKTKKQEGSRKRGRPQLRWEDRGKRDLRKAEEEEKWREKTKNRDRWKQITKVAVLRSDQ